MKKKTKVTTGMIETPYLPSLQEIEAYRKFKKFKSTDIGEYEQKIKSMTPGELYTHCQEVGLRSVGEKRHCILNLVNLFREAQAVANRYENLKVNSPSIPEPHYL